MTSKMDSIIFVLFLALFSVSVTAQSCGSRYRSAILSLTSFLTSPNYPLNYPSSITCQWTITAPSGYVVELSFVTFETRGYVSSGSCSISSDTLEIYDGSYTSSSNLRGKYCNSYLPANVYSSGTTLNLKFKVNNYFTKKGFKIKYTAVKPKPDSSICSPFNTVYQNNNIRLSGSSGYIESPLYGTKYPSNMQCTWVITVPEGKKIKLTFSDFNLGGSSYCSSYSNNYDQLQIRDGQYSFSTSLKKLCGEFLPAAVYSEGRYLWIQFKSDLYNDNAKKSTGFKAKYETQSTGSDTVGIVVGIVIAVCVVIFLVCICVCIAHRKRTPGHVTVQAPAVTQRTTIQGTQNPAVVCQYPQQMQGGFVPPPPAGYNSAPKNNYSGGYQPPPQGSYQYPPAPQGSYQNPLPGSNPTTTGGGTSAPAYPPQSSVPMMPYPQQPIPNDPPPAYPGPPAYPPQAAAGQPTPNNANPPYPPSQGAGIQQSSPPYPPQAATGQPALSSPNPPYPPPQGMETQQPSPYPPAQDTKQATAPPLF